MWIARNKIGLLYLFNIKPFRTETGWDVDRSIPNINSIETFKSEIVKSQSMVINKDLFPYLKWEDEPIEVELFN